MSLLPQLIADFTIEEPEYDRTELVSWSIEVDQIIVNYNQSILLNDYYYAEGDNEVHFDSVDFTINCNCIYVVKPEDVTLGGSVRLEYRTMLFNQIVEAKVETDGSYNAQTLVDNLMLDLTDSGPMPSIDIAIPIAILKFVELA